MTWGTVYKCYGIRKVEEHWSKLSVWVSHCEKAGRAVCTGFTTGPPMPCLYPRGFDNNLVPLGSLFYSWVFLFCFINKIYCFVFLFLKMTEKKRENDVTLSWDRPGSFKDSTLIECVNCYLLYGSDHDHPLVVIKTLLAVCSWIPLWLLVATVPSHSLLFITPKECFTQISVFLLGSKQIWLI